MVLSKTKRFVFCPRYKGKARMEGRYLTKGKGWFGNHLYPFYLYPIHLSKGKAGGALNLRTP